MGVTEFCPEKGEKLSCERWCFCAERGEKFSGG